VALSVLLWVVLAGQAQRCVRDRLEHNEGYVHPARAAVAVAASVDAGKGQLDVG
jgi:hypothetical protein